MCSDESLFTSAFVLFPGAVNRRSTCRRCRRMAASRCPWRVAWGARGVRGARGAQGAPTAVALRWGGERCCCRLRPRRPTSRRPTNCPSRSCPCDPPRPCPCPCRSPNFSRSPSPPAPPLMRPTRPLSLIGKFTSNHLLMPTHFQFIQYTYL